MSNPAPKYPNRAAALRAKLLSQPVEPAEPIVIDGETFYIRSPLMADRTKIGEIAGMTLQAKQAADGSTTVDMNQVPIVAMLAAAVVVLAVDEVGTPICTAADLETLQAQPSGGWVQTLGEACLKKANGEKKEDAKPSAPPTVDASPSSSQTDSAAPSASSSPASS